MNEQKTNEYEYVGFWSRVGASLIDTIIMMIIIIPLMYMFYGDELLYSESIVLGPADVVLNYLFPIVAVILFWVYKSATPGKMAIKAVIVDANTGKKPTVLQYVIRYFGYILSTLPLGLGFMWIGWDSKKQGWHDKLSSTVVIRPKSHGVESVMFDK